MSDLITITFQSEGIDEVSAMFEAGARRSTNLTEPLRKSSAMMMKNFDMNFNDHGRTFGEPWKRRKVDPGWPMLEHTGLMKHSFAYIVSTGQAILFNRQPYFKYHQSRAPRTTALPRRVMMKFDELRRRQIVKNFQEYIMEQS